MSLFFLFLGRNLSGVTAVGYNLMVCGGQLHNKEVDSNCFSLDVNSSNPTWKSMEPMSRCVYCKLILLTLIYILDSDLV